MPHNKTLVRKTLVRQVKRREHGGYVLLVLLVLLALTAGVVSGSLQLTSTAVRTNYSFTLRTQRLYEAERALNISVGWLRKHSAELVESFRRNSVYVAFERSSVPAIGDNDKMHSQYSRAFLAGTNEVPMLTNSAALGTSRYPGLVSGFDPIASFAALDLGTAFVKVTLLDVVPQNPAADYGPPPNPPPATDFYPVFRIDAMSSTDQGAHVFGNVIGHLNADTTPGFFAWEDFQLEGSCDAYDSASGNYGNSNRKPTCEVGAVGEVCLKLQGTVYGRVWSNSSISEHAVCRGTVCADFGCNTAGSRCEGDKCGSGPETTFKTWETYCPSGRAQADVEVKKGAQVTLSVTDDTPEERCWDNVDVNTKGVLLLETTAVPYYIKHLRLNDEVWIVPDSPNAPVQLYVEQLDGPHATQQFVNTTGRPSQFKLVYLGTDRFSANQHLDMQMMLTAPNAEVWLLGNIEFFGSIAAKSIRTSSRANLHFDEQAQRVQVGLVDANFELRQLVQRFH